MTRTSNWHDVGIHIEKDELSNGDTVYTASDDEFPTVKGMGATVQEAVLDLLLARQEIARYLVEHLLSAPSRWLEQNKE